MKIVITVILMLFFYSSSHAQRLDQSITDLANDIAQKVTRKNKTRLALTDFVNNQGKVDALTDYIRKELEVKLINAENLQVMDRKHIKLLLSDNNLQKDGVIDESIAKSSTSFIKVDGWIIAEVTTLGDKISIKATVSDVSTSMMYAASSIVFNADDLTVKSLLDPAVKVCTECKGKGTIQVQTICTVCGGKGNCICRQCKGAGIVESGTWRGRYERCEGCNGAGKTDCGICSGKGKTFSYITCPKCNGQNMVDLNGGQEVLVKKDICTACGGSGKIKHQSTCGYCGSTGKLLKRFQMVNCDYCAGTGVRTTFEPCTVCNGTGKL